MDIQWIAARPRLHRTEHVHPITYALVGRNPHLPHKSNRIGAADLGERNGAPAEFDFLGDVERRSDRRALGVRGSGERVAGDR